MKNLIIAERIGQFEAGDTLNTYRISMITLYHLLWSFGQILLSFKKYYAVQTAELPIQRCILMTTDPGDLIFDPTCGSVQLHTLPNNGAGAGSPVTHLE